MNHTAAALHDLAWGGDQVVSEDWTKGQSSTAKAGVLVVLGVTVEIPLVREPVQTVTLNDFAPMTMQFTDSFNPQDLNDSESGGFSDAFGSAWGG